ncbi:MAG TPA: type IV secretory system conjugative DNA transfer family protein [Acidimicrobiales bacterium]
MATTTRRTPIKTFSPSTHDRAGLWALRVARDASAHAQHGLYLGHDAHTWHHAEAQQSVLALGPPRSGKTSALLIPNVLSAHGAVVTTSTKPDVLDATREARSMLGTCHLFDPTGSVDDRPGVHRLRWSPLTGCSSWRTALSAARSLVLVGSGGAGAARTEGSHWTERAQALLAPLLHAAAIEGADMRTVLTWVDRRQALPAQQAFSGPAGDDRAIARDLLDGIVTTDERELSGIWSTASGALGGFRSTQALAATCNPDFDPVNFVRSADTLYIAAPAHHQSLVAPLVVGLIDDVRRAAYGRAASGLERSDPPVVLALDELANVAPLPELPSMVSEGGGQGLVTLACFQDLSQARHRWPGQADGFPSLFGTTVVLPGIGDVATLEALSVLAGDEELVTRSVNRSHVLTGRPLTDLLSHGRPQVGEQLSTQWRRRLAPDEITRGRPGSALAFDARNQPSWVTLAPAHRTEPWVSLRGHDREPAAIARDTGRAVVPPVAELGR